ncbi:MAG: S1 RNA-binding domain-containing protein [Elusimicrobiales bacterium]|nr:S1 RNA-binding domain-containing protein [Elusimicrobiales bacterium]
METNETQHIEDQDGEKRPSAPGAEEEMSMADLLKAEAAVSEKIYSRDVVTVKVVQVTPELVLVDIGEKKEGAIPLADFQDEKAPVPGDEVQAVLEKKGVGDRYTMLSHRRAREKAAWEMTKKLFEAKERVKGRVAEIVKGGYIVDISGMRAFMPLSLSELGGAHKHYLPPNAKIKFYITDFNEKDRKVVVSRRQVLEEDETARRGQVLTEISPGRVVRGVVSKVTEEGLLVRFQGIEGQVRLADLAWKDPAEALKGYKRGQRVKCKILGVDKDKEHISFGLKQLMPNPVDMLKRRFAYKSRVKGKVASVAPEGAVVKIGEHTEAFIPAEDYGAEGAPKDGQEVSGMVMGINSSNFRLTLSVKRCEEMEDRKRMQQYLKGSPSLTLGQILLENSEDEGEL